MAVKFNTIERLAPDQVNAEDVTGQASLKLHLQRYEFAAGLVRPGRLLDIACGSGYGTRLLAEKSAGVIEAVGVDISAESIEYARRRYGRAGVIFQQNDAMTFQDEKKFDSIVSIETIEHVQDPGGLVGRLCGLLKCGGVFIASVPTTPSADVNPYHLNDFTERSFRSMFLSRGFTEIVCLRQIQPYPLIRTLKREESRMKDMRRNLMAYYFWHPASLARRLWFTIRYGFTNRYITIAWQKKG